MEVLGRSSSLGEGQSGITAAQETSGSLRKSLIYSVQGNSLSASGLLLLVLLAPRQFCLAVTDV